MDNPYASPSAHQAEESHRRVVEGAMMPSGRTWMRACLRFASSIGKGLAVIVAVVAIYIALIAGILYALIWLALRDFDIDAY